MEQVVKNFEKKLWCVGMFLQKAMKQGRNVHSISHVIHAHKGCGHIVWVTCLLRFCLPTHA